METIRAKITCGGACWLVLALLGLGCGESELSVTNRAAQVTSVGPVEPVEENVRIQYTLLDREGDDQNVKVEVCPADAADADSCPVPVQGLGGDGLSRLPTVPEGTDVPHRFAWRVGCGLVDGDTCIRPELQTEYVVRVSVKGASSTRQSSAFTLGDDLEMEELPACNAEILEVPEPCPPGGGG